MTTKEFIALAPKLSKIKGINLAKKGEKNPMLGIIKIGTTERQNQILWRKYGTLVNIIINDTAENINKQLIENDISEFIAIKTKSGFYCRLKTV